MEIFISRDGRQHGPYSLEQLQQFIAQGQAQLTDSAWYEGLAGWIPLGEVPGVVVAEGEPAINPRKKRPMRQGRTRKKRPRRERTTGGKLKRPGPKKSDRLIATTEEMGDLEYVGFWVRVVSSGLDSPMGAIACLVIYVLSFLRLGVFVAAIFGNPDPITMGWLGASYVAFQIFDLFLYLILLHIIEILFWVHLSATPGKLALRMNIVDARTGRKPTTRQFVIRSLSKWISVIPFGLGYIAVAFNRRKRGWHDRIAGTMVIMGQQGDRDGQQRKKRRKSPAKSLSPADEIT